MQTVTPHHWRRNAAGDGSLIATNRNANPTAQINLDQRASRHTTKRSAVIPAEEVAQNWRKRGESAYGSIRNPIACLGRWTSSRRAPAPKLRSRWDNWRSVLGCHRRRSTRLGLIRSRPHPASKSAPSAINSSWVRWVIASSRPTTSRMLTEVPECIYPGLRQFSEGNQVAIAVQKAAAARDIEIANAWREWRGKHGSGLEAAQKFSDEVLPGISGKMFWCLRQRIAVGSRAEGSQRPRPAAVRNRCPSQAQLRTVIGSRAAIRLIRHRGSARHERHHPAVGALRAQGAPAQETDGPWKRYAQPDASLGIGDIAGGIIRQERARPHAWVR